MQHIIKLLIMDRKQSLDMIEKKNCRIKALTNGLAVVSEQFKSLKQDYHKLPG